MEELQSRHRKEQQDLLAKITQKKKSATKKMRKGVNDECDRLQRDLDEKQQAEIFKLNGEPLAQLVNGIDGLELDYDDDDEQNFPITPLNTRVEEQLPTPTLSSQPPTTKKPNRQKARLARRAAEQDALVAVAAQEAASQPDRRGNEREAMQSVFSRLRLKEREIQPNGHCLYSAVASQLAHVGLSLKPSSANIELAPVTASRVDAAMSTPHDGDGYRAVRAVTADFILANQGDFAPFMEEPVDVYARKIRLSAEWGGQLELQAIARAYGVEIDVVQGDGRIERIEAGDAAVAKESKKIWLAYYRHTYGLGEHYNALMKGP
jgi:OTU domain-containing protein 6